MEHPDQLELKLQAAPDVQVVRFPDGEIRLKPRPPMVTGSTRDAARVLGVSKRTVQRMIDEGTIVAWRPSKRWYRVDMASVYALKNAALAEKSEITDRRCDT